MSHYTGGIGGSFSSPASALGANLRVKCSTTTLVLAGTGEAAIGTMQQRCETDERPTVRYRNEPGPRVGIADGVIAVNAPVYGGASGKFSASVSGAIMGIAITAAAADGDEFQVLMQ